MLCYVVGFRRLMPADALQPKAYCTNPGLQSFLLAPPGVSTSSERRNYLGEKWPVISTESCDFHATLSGSFTCLKYATWDKRPYFPSEGRHAEDFFFALKNPTASAGFEPANLGTKSSTLLLDHRSHYTLCYKSNIGTNLRIIQRMEKNTTCLSKRGVSTATRLGT